MIPRYTRSEMGAIWEDLNYYEKWLDVELATTAVLGEECLVPKEAAAAIKSKANFSIERINEIEAEVKHNIIAFTTCVADYVGPEHSGWFHYGLTSSDILDTAMALQVKQASTIILTEIDNLLFILKKRAYEFRTAVMIGRTHGIHAEHTTFGLKLANFYDEFLRHRENFVDRTEEMRVGKLSGAVGTFEHLGPQIEEKVMAKLELKPASIASQVIQRERHARYISSIADIAGTLERMALTVRLLQQTEVREAEEYFSPKQKGSSAMPHKRNPITSEQICGLARIIRGFAFAARENVALWHERDISHSSAERIIFPDCTVLIDYLLAKTSNLIDRLVVYPERMKGNLELTCGVIYSGEVLLVLVEKGQTREQAYKMVQGCAMYALDEGLRFRSVIGNDPEIKKLMTPNELDEIFTSTKLLASVDYIFERVFGKE